MGQVLTNSDREGQIFLSHPHTHDRCFNYSPSPCPPITRLKENILIFGRFTTKSVFTIFI